MRRRDRRRSSRRLRNGPVNGERARRDSGARVNSLSSPAELPAEKSSSSPPFLPFFFDFFDTALPLPFAAALPFDAASFFSGLTSSVP